MGYLYITQSIYWWPLVSDRTVHKILIQLLPMYWLREFIISRMQGILIWSNSLQNMRIFYLFLNTVRFRSDSLQNAVLFSLFFEEFCFIDGDLIHIFNVLYRWEYFVCHLLVLFLYIITLEWQFLVSYFLELCTSNHMIGWLICLLNLLPFSNPQKVSSTYIIHCFLFMMMLLYSYSFFNCRT